MFVERHIVPITVDASGDAIAYTPVCNGQVLQIHYVKTDFADTVDFTITGESTGQAILAQSNVTASFVKAPRQPVYDQSGAAMLHAAGGTALAAPILVVKERVKIVVAQGGVSKTGSIHVVIG